MVAERRKVGILEKYGQEEAHARFAFSPDARCAGCKRPFPSTRIILMFPLEEMQKRPEWTLFCFNHPEKAQALLVRLKHGIHVRARTVYACTTCSPAAEREAAKAPSWATVEINRGPKHLGRKVYGCAGETG